MDLSWMAWTWQTVAFFGVIALLLLVMTILALRRPEVERPGVLRIATTRGDRLFISLLSAAWVHLGWLAAFGAPLWGALALSVILAALIFRFV